MKKKTVGVRRRRQLAVLLAVFSMLLAGGCGKREAEETGASKTVGAEEETDAGGKGRFLETQLELPEEYAGALAIRRLDDGRILIMDQGMQRFISKDDGSSWEMPEEDWREEAGDIDGYISSCVLDGDGGFAFLYMVQEGEEYHYEGGMVAADGAYRKLPLDGAGLDGEIYKLCGSAPDGRVLGVSDSGTVYAIDPADGKAESLFQTEGGIGEGNFLNGRLTLTATDQVYFYDFAAGALLDPDEALQSLVTGSLSGQIGISEDSQPLALAVGDGAEELYLAYREGVYRHTIGTQELEQVILGGLTSFGDPQAGLVGLVRTSDGGFLAAFTGGLVCRYTFDETVSTVPEKQMTIYSLTDNYTVRQAISLYQKDHPDTYIRLETGLADGENGKTKEDALKQLNTQILAGKGPDMLLLDGLPAKSYLEKGVLLDLTDELESFAGEDALFPNLVEACRSQDGKIYSLPARFRLPMLAGKKERINGIGDLVSLAEAVESIRREQPDGRIINTVSENETLRLLGVVSSAAWVKEDSSVDEEALTEFFTQAKRVHTAEIAGIPADLLEGYDENDMVMSSDVAGEGSYYLETGHNLWPLCEEAPDVLAAGAVKDVLWTFPLVTSVLSEHPEYDFTFYQGQVKNSFLPRAQAAICADSGQMELAKDFFRYLFTKEAQLADTVDGYPVNEAALTEMLESAMKQPEGAAGTEEEDTPRHLGGMGAENSQGDFVLLTVNAPTRAQSEKFLAMVRTVDTPCSGNAVVEELVYEIGPEILNGKMSVEEGVAEVEKRAALYLAE